MVEEERPKLKIGQQICIMQFIASILLPILCFLDINMNDLNFTTAILFITLTLSVGLYGIWRRDSRFIIGTALILLLVAFRQSYNFLSSQATVIIFGVLFISYVELSHGAIRFSRLEGIEKAKETDVVILNLREALRQYFLLFPVLIVATCLLTVFVFNFNKLLMIFCTEQFSQSIELDSLYGVALSLGIIFGCIVVGRTLLHRETL